MSNPILTATLRAKDETGKTLKGIVTGFTRAFTDIAKIAVGVLLRDVTRAMVGIGKESLALGAQIETLQNSFEALKIGVDDEVLSIKTLREAVDGTVSDVDLLTEANKALALGLPVEQLNELFAAARKVGAAMGRTTLQSVQDLTTGIGRQSKLILDNLGIIVNTEQAYEDYAIALGKSSSELDDNERKTAFTTAAIASLNLKAAQLGDNISEITTLNEQFNTSMTNLKTEIGTFLIPIISDLSKKFMDEWLPSIKDIIELFRSRDFEGIGLLIRDTFMGAVERVKQILANVDWIGLWNQAVLIATDVFNQVSTIVQEKINSIPWAEVWDSLLTYAGNLWDDVKGKLLDWGKRFEEDILPQSADEWKAAWGALFDFAENLWDTYFVPALKELIPVLTAWLPSDPEEWANAWIGLWTFAGELWDRLLKATTNIVTEFVNYVKNEDWTPLIKAFDDTIGEVIRGVVNRAWESALGFLDMTSAYKKYAPSPSFELGNVEPNYFNPGTVGPPSFLRNIESITGNDAVSQYRSEVNITIENFIGLDAVSTKRQLTEVLNEYNVTQLSRRGALR